MSGYNEAREQRGMDMLNTYEDRYGEDHGEDEATLAVDLITDVMHALYGPCGATESEIEQAVAMATIHFEEEASK